MLRCDGFFKMYRGNYPTNLHNRHSSSLPGQSQARYTFRAMSQSPFPFHGIFSTLGQEQGVRQSPGMMPAPETPQFQMQQPQEQYQQDEAVGQVAVDIYEQDDYYIIKAPIAGVRLCDLDIEVADNVVTIRGVRRNGDPLAAEQYYLQECFWGEFSRSITLPVVVDPKRIRATFNKECILKILIPKEERVRIVRISDN